MQWSTSVYPDLIAASYVVGCSRGVGRAIALAFARQGVLGLVISTKSSELSDDFLTHIDINVTRVVVVKADVTKADEVA